MDTLKEAISNLRSAIAYSKKPGNEGQALAASTGSYRPVSEVLTPALEALEGIEGLLTELETISSENFGSNHPVIRSLRYALDNYGSKVDSSHVSLNRAKAQMKGNRGV